MPRIYKCDDQSVAFHDPNKIVVERKHIKDAYIAIRENEPIANKKSVMYTVELGDTLIDIGLKHNTTATKIKKDNNLGSDTIHVGEILVIESIEKTNKVTFTKTNQINVGDEVYIIAETENAVDLRIDFYLKQGVEKGIVEVDQAITLQQHGKDVDYATTRVGEYAKDASIENKDDFKNWAIAKVTMQPLDEEKQKAWNDALEGLPDKKSKFYVVADAHTRKEKDYLITYYGYNPDDEGKPDHKTTPNRWLDMDGEWLELEACDCCSFEVDGEGFVIHDRIIKEHVPQIEHGNFSDPKKSIKYIVLHRTVTATARGTIDNGFKKKRGGTYYGTHFLIDKDGTSYQCASLKKYTYHVSGKNSKSIGIEVVGQPYDKDGKLTPGYPNGNPVDHWDVVPDEQAKAVACIVNGLLKHYGLEKSDIKNHEDLQAKTKGEGKTVYDAIINLIK